MENTSTVTTILPDGIRVATESVVILEKLSQRSLQEKVIRNNLDTLLNSVNTRALAVRGWVVEELGQGAGKSWKKHYNSDPETASKFEFRYELWLSVKFVPSDETKRPEPHELQAILRTINTRCGQPAFGRWTLATVDGAPYKPSGEDDGENGENVGYAKVEIPQDWDDFFAHLYGLDPQITRVLRSLEAGVLSDWESRFNCALVGPPGCGKSAICQAIKQALGEDAVLEFDATSTTAAGAIKELTEREILPRVIVIEEIEKADEKAMSFLLSVLDLRSQIRKTTARTSVVRDTKLFAIATVNDVPLFRKLQAGALASRFSNVIAFKRPSRDQLAKILLREVEKIGGNTKWIDPTLTYCEENGITDPRRVISICLCGRDLLLNGEYQKLLAATDWTRADELAN